MADQTAFFYGTLMAPKILYRVCFGTTTPQAHQTKYITIQPAILPNHGRHRVKNVDYPGVIPVPTPGTSSSSTTSHTPSVLGTYVTGLTPQDIRRLDYFEGEEYARRDVKVKVLKGSVGKVQAEAAKGTQVGGEDEVEREVTTQTYIYLDGSNLEEREWDFEEFKREKMAAWTLEGSEEYHDIPYDDGESGKARDGTGGRGAGGDITKQLDAAV